MPNLQGLEWGLKIYDGTPTLTTHVPSIHKTHTEHNSKN